MPAGRPKGIPKTGGRVKIPTNKKRTMYMTDSEYEQVREFIKVIRKDKSE
jgi:hypothetical protein